VSCAAGTRLGAPGITPPTTAGPDPVRGADLSPVTCGRRSTPPRPSPPGCEQQDGRRPYATIGKVHRPRHQVATANPVLGQVHQRDSHVGHRRLHPRTPVPRQPHQRHLQHVLGLDRVRHQQAGIPQQTVAVFPDELRELLLPHCPHDPQDENRSRTVASGSKLRLLIRTWSQITSPVMPAIGRPSRSRNLTWASRGQGRSGTENSSDPNDFGTVSGHRPQSRHCAS
jgi:hypothetical protein